MHPKLSGEQDSGNYRVSQVENCFWCRTVLGHSDAQVYLKYQWSPPGMLVHPSFLKLTFNALPRSHLRSEVIDTLSVFIGLSDQRWNQTIIQMQTVHILGHCLLCSRGWSWNCVQGCRPWSLGLPLQCDRRCWAKVLWFVSDKILWIVTIMGF